MAKPVNREAALHLALGALKAQDVPVGDHDLEDVDVTIRFKKGARVVRAEGTAGNGFDKAPEPKAGEGGAPKLTLTMGAVLKFLDRSGVKHGPDAKERWATCIREDITDSQLTLPGDVVEALALVEAEQAKLALTKPAPATTPADATEPQGKRTPAKRTGEKEAEILVKRLPKAAQVTSAAVKKPARKKK